MLVEDLRLLLSEFVSRAPSGTLVLVDLASLDDSGQDPDFRVASRAERVDDDFLIYVGDPVKEASSRLTAMDLLKILEGLPAGSESCTVEATAGVVDIGDHSIRIDSPVCGSGEDDDGSSILLVHGSRPAPASD